MPPPDGGGEESKVTTSSDASKVMSSDGPAARKRALLQKTRSRGTFLIVSVLNFLHAIMGCPTLRGPVCDLTIPVLRSASCKNRKKAAAAAKSASLHLDATKVAAAAMAEASAKAAANAEQKARWIAAQRKGPPPGHDVVGTAIGLDIDSIGYTLCCAFLTVSDVCRLACTCSNLAEVVRGADFVWRTLIETTFGSSYNESVARQMSGSPTPSTIRFADGAPGHTPTPDCTPTPRVVERPCKHLLLFRMQLCFERERARILTEFETDRVRLNRWMHSERERQGANVQQKLRVRAMRRQIRALERERDALEEQVREQKAQEVAVQQAQWAVAQEAAEGRGKALAEKVAQEAELARRARAFAAEVAAGGGWKAERDRRRQMYGDGGGGDVGRRRSTACTIS